MNADHDHGLYRRENRIRKAASVKKRSNQNSRALTAVLIFVCLLAIVFYLSGGVVTYKDKNINMDEAVKTRMILESMEERPLYDPEKADMHNEVQEQELQSVPEVDIAALQAEILANFGDYDYNSEYFRGWFEDSAIVGDSMAQAIAGFDWIYERNLQAQIGISLPSCADVIEGTIWLQPSVIFLTFSANNIATYGTGIDSYINDYSDIINELKANVPGAEIYTEAVLPCDPDFSDEYWYYDYLDDYNAAMRQMCEELDVHYFDPGFILDAHPEIYSEDGLHPTWEFYPLWMTYMAEIAGLG